MTVFLRKSEEYVRDIDVMSGYMEQTALYLHKMTGKSIDVVREWMKKEFSDKGRFEVNTPMADINLRDPETGDRRTARISMGKLLKVVREKDLISPASMTFYMPASFKRSYLSMFIEENIQNRARVKGEMFAAKAAGNKVLASNKKNEQNSFKTLNNSLSGAHSSAFTILFNKSSHSTLTSTCRSATSYGNANNEKLLAGNRHYWLAGIAVNNILATITLTDMVEFEEFANVYKIHLPTVKEVMDAVMYSCDLYWQNYYGEQRIEKLIKTLTPLERAAFLYIGDLYHFRKYNPEIIREWIDDLIIDINDVDPDIDIESIEKRSDGDLTAYVALLRSDIVGSSNFKDIKKSNPDGYKLLMATCDHVMKVCEKRELLIRNLMTTDNVPASIARMPEAIRRVSLVSDTDSTMATAERWAEWHCGETAGKLADKVGDTMIYIATQNIAHMMARMSTQMGVEEKYKFRYSMKNEFKFGAFALTNKTKHYFSSITSQEGTLSEEPELEVKGVALRTSNIPNVIMNGFREELLNMLLTVQEGKKIEILPLLNKVADIELGIKRSISNGELMYLKTGQIKNKEAYTTPETSKYVYYEWWRDTFAYKYGDSGEPTYSFVKLNVTLHNKTAIKKWISDIEDRELANRIQAWHNKYPDKKLTQLLLPEAIVVKGIPKEILMIADYRRAMFASVEPYYHALECLGVRLIDKNRSRLISDFYGTEITTHEDDITDSNVT